MMTSFHILTVNSCFTLIFDVFIHLTAFSFDTDVINGSTKDTLELHLTSVVNLLQAIVGAVVCYGYTCDELQATHMYTWAKVASVIFFMAAFGGAVPYYGAIIAYRKWAKNYDEAALVNTEGPQPPMGDAALNSEWTWYDIFIVPCAANMQVLVVVIICGFLIDGIVSLVYTSNTCGRHSPLWRHGLMVFLGPYCFLIMVKIVLGLYESNSKSRERLAYEEIRRQAAMQLTSEEDVLIKQGANFSNNIGELLIASLSYSMYFLAMAGYGI